MAEHADQIQNLLQSFNRIQEGEKIVNKAFLEETASIARVASRCDINLEEITTLLKSAFSSGNKYLGLYAANSLVLVLGNRTVPTEDLEVIIDGLKRNRKNRSFREFDEWEPGVRLLGPPRISIDEALSNLTEGNPQAVSRIMRNMCAKWCYGDEIRDCLVIYQQTRDEGMFHFLLSQLERFFTRKNLCYDQGLVAGILLDALCTEPPDLEALYEVLLLLLHQLEPGSSGRKEVEAAISRTKHEESLPYLLIALREDREKSDNLGLTDYLANRVSRRENERQENLLAHFPANLTRQVRLLFRELCVLDELPAHSDRERQKVRERCALHFLEVFRMRSTLLIPFVLRFCRTEQAKSDLVYLLSRLPKEEGVPFLEECGRFAPDEDDFVFTIALASSYLRGLTPTGEPESSISRGVHAPDGNARTWIGDLGMERRIHDALLHANEEFSRLYEANPSTHEERLTGFFLARLQQNMTAFEEDLHCWARQRFGGYSSLSCQLEDVAASGPEKVWGADIGFHLVLRIRDTLQAERGILVQAKKAALKEGGSPDGYIEMAWPIDRAQRDILIGKSAYSLYFLYGLHSTGVGVQTIPASTVRDIMEGTQMKSRLSARVALSSSRSFPDLFLYDFLGNWWGDEETSVLEVVRGLDDAFGVRRLFRVVVSLGSVG